jgi:hypothetical protein
MSTLEQLWAYALLTGAAAMAVFTVLTWRRGWVRNEEDNETVYRKDHPRSFVFVQLLQIVGVAILLYVGLRGLQGWK